MRTEAAAVLRAEATSPSRAAEADPAGAPAHRAACLACIADAARRHGGHPLEPEETALEASFADVRAAAAAAAEALEALERLEGARPLRARMHFRCGIDRPRAEGTAVASALARLAPRGGFCLSSDVFDPSLEGVAPGLAPIGERSFPSAPAPVGVYRWDPLGVADLPASLVPRWLAWLVLAALVASGVWTTWIVVAPGP